MTRLRVSLAAISLRTPRRFRPLALLFLAGLTLASHATRADEYDTLRNRWKVMLTGGTGYTTTDPGAVSDRVLIIQNTAQGFIGKFRTSPAAGQSLWTDDDPNEQMAWPFTSAAITASYNRLKQMAVSYATPGSSHYQNSSVHQKILDGLIWMHANQYFKQQFYHPTTNAYRSNPFGNWWDWRIGAPIEMLETIIIVYNGSNITATQLANYLTTVDTSTPASTTVMDYTGANRSWVAKVWALRGILQKTITPTTPASTPPPGNGSASLLRASERLTALFDSAPGVGSDNFHPDGSFIQHQYYPYTGGYGIEVLRDVTDLLYLLHGSTWENEESARTNILKRVHDTYAPFIYKGAFMSMVRGREIKRPYSQDHKIGHQAMGYMVRAAQLADLIEPASKLAIQEAIKYWMTEDKFLDFIKETPNIDILLQAIALRGSSAIGAMDEPEMFKPFPQMDRFVHLRPGFGYGISAFS
ncbi:MAG: hypothetical protein V4773_02185, partial [Verrucomicrobiota bacterium]